MVLSSNQPRRDELISFPYSDEIRTRLFRYTLGQPNIFIKQIKKTIIFCKSWNIDPWYNLTFIWRTVFVITYKLTIKLQLDFKEKCLTYKPRVKV